MWLGTEVGAAVCMELNFPMDQPRKIYLFYGFVCYKNNVINSNMYYTNGYVIHVLICRMSFLLKSTIVRVAMFVIYQLCGVNILFVFKQPKYIVCY